MNIVWIIPVEDVRVWNLPLEWIVAYRRILADTGLSQVLSNYRLSKLVSRNKDSTEYLYDSSAQD